MADSYDSEREQIEAIKKWWQENGRVVTVGLVLGLGGVFGWTAWQNHANAKAEQASVTYAEMINWAAEQNYTRSNELAATLMRDYSNSGYAAYGGLVRASNAFNQNRPDEARAYLQWVIDNARRPQLQNLARLRIARLAADNEEYQAALEFLDGGEPGTFLAGYQETRGDISVGQNELEAAAKYYTSALDAPRISDSGRRRIEMKLSDLGLSD